jgi:hypothetical protein
MDMFSILEEKYHCIKYFSKKFNGKSSLRKHRHRRVNNIKTELRELGCRSVEDPNATKYCPVATSCASSTGDNAFTKTHV